MDFIDLKTQQQLIKSDLDHRIAKVLSHGAYIMGPEVKELEDRLSAYTGSPYTVTCANGTDALQLVLMALEIKPGDEVITTPFTFIATAETISLMGGVPVFVDIDPETYLIDPSKIEEAITAKTIAIIPVSLYGQCADMRAINKIAEQNGITVIEDAAQSFGATQNGVKSCNLSKIATSSFFPSKPLGCYGDGGVVFTSDKDISDRITALRAHGQTKRYYHPWIGINSRLDTIQAAIILSKLEIFDSEIIQRSKVADRYSNMLRDSSVNAPKLADGNSSVYAQYTIAVNNRDELRSVLSDNGIPTAVHYPMPLDQQPAIKGICRVQSNKYSLEYSEKVMSLPMHPYLSESDQNKVTDLVIKFAK